MPRLRAMSPVRIDVGVHFRGADGSAVAIDVLAGTDDLAACLATV
jgi:hypothetical protein